MEKQNIILIGPTGVGKTYIIEQITQALDLPFAKVDATSYTAAGYVGGDVDDIIRKNLLSSAGDDVEHAERGIVYIDEIDKICASVGGTGPDIGGDKVQAALLKLIEGKEISIVDQRDFMGRAEMAQRKKTGKKVKETINTKDILFIVGGAFSRGSNGSLVDVIKERVSKDDSSDSYEFSPFGLPQKNKKTLSLNDYIYLKDTKPEDFVCFGMGHEWIGRFPAIVPLENLDKGALVDILKKDADDSLIKQYKQRFKWIGVDLEFTEPALKLIAEKAVALKTGARGLSNVLFNVLFEYQYELEGIGVKELKVTKEIVEDYSVSLKAILKKV